MSRHGVAPSDETRQASLNSPSVSECGEGMETVCTYTPRSRDVRVYVRVCMICSRHHWWPTDVTWPLIACLIVSVCRWHSARGLIGQHIQVPDEVQSSQVQTSIIVSQRTYLGKSAMPRPHRPQIVLVPHSHKRKLHLYSSRAQCERSTAQVSNLADGTTKKATWLRGATICPFCEGVITKFQKRNTCRAGW